MMPGTKGRSGPPGHSHSRGNSGGDGGPKGNANALTHGLRSDKLPAGCEDIAEHLQEFLSLVEATVAERNDGEISLHDAATIGTAFRYERHALLAQRWLHLHDADMDHATRLAYSRDIAKASAERDKCLRAMGLDAKREQGFLAEYEKWLRSPLPSEPQADQSADQQQDAPADAVGDVATDHIIEARGPQQ